MPTIDAHPTASISPGARIIGKGSVRLGAFAIVEDNALLDLGADKSSLMLLDNRSKIKFGAVLRAFSGSITIGKRCSIGEYTYVGGHGGVVLHDAVIVGPHCVVNAADHIDSGIIPIRFLGETARGVTISRGAWLGARVTVLDGVVVGENTTIGAGAIVTRTMPSHTVCFGHPCRVIASKVRRFK